MAVRIHREWGLRGSLARQVRVAKEAKRLGYTRKDSAKVRSLELEVKRLEKGNRDD
jgi:hypothetical protein